LFSRGAKSSDFLKFARSGSVRIVFRKSSKT
jgi:hypothetical protein